MGFTVNNSFGKFSAETHMPLPSFSAESLMSLPTKQFGAATLDGDNVTNYEEGHWSKFDVDKSANTINQDGLIYTRSDKGFQFTNDDDSGKTLSIKLHNAAKTLSQVFTLNPGDTMSRDGGYSTVVVVPKGGTEEVDGVVTAIPWMDGWRPSEDDATADNGNKKFSYDMGGSGNGTHGYHVEVLPAAEYVIPNAGNGGSDNGGSDNGDNGDNGDEGDDTEEGPNYLLYGGGLALLVVGGIMASKMLKK